MIKIISITHSDKYNGQSLTDEAFETLCKCLEKYSGFVHNIRYETADGKRFVRTIGAY